ncbi:MAG: GHKL domain-containing protein [Desulfobacterales bacterium]|nr:GHKL domain-containing protein [Desulfobacterales bacterium]MBS3756335.1 GHKL domain-containing protein [Desulfobacterales bacterium]
MVSFRSKAAQDLHRKLKWLIFFRALFGVVLLGSILVPIMRPDMELHLAGRALDYLLLISLGILVLSVVYVIVLPWIGRLMLFAYIQVGIDTFLVTLIIFVTGSFSSIFAFMYLVVIVYATMVTYRSGGMVIATLCCIQYGLMIDLEYYGIIHPLGYEADFLSAGYDWPYIIYKLLLTIVACYAVATLSGFLSEQERSAKRDLWAMEDQMKRMERLAAVGEMAAGLAHEIKNPLASLTGSIQMMQDQLDYDPEQERLMQIVMREADRLSTLVTDFLRFAKPGPGNAEVIRLDGVVSEVVGLFASDPRYQSEIEVKTDLAAGLHVKIDPEHLRQVLWNLLYNAAEALEDRGEIEVKVYPGRKNHACISITDNGPGMDEQTLSTVFDPFFSTKSGGTGLGLSIVQQVVGAHGGLVDIDSTPDRGTTVTIRLRRHPS